MEANLEFVFEIQSKNPNENVEDIILKPYLLQSYSNTEF